MSCNDMLQICVQVLAEENQRQIVDFCKKEGLVLLADEVSLHFLSIAVTYIS